MDNIPKPKVWGRLSLQIVVDLEGNSCLLSMYNQTTLLSAQLNLKKDIDQHLVWEKPAQKVAALVVLDFYGRRTTVKRIGLDADTGWHELTVKAGRVRKLYYYNYYHSKGIKHDESIETCSNPHDHFYQHCRRFRPVCWSAQEVEGKRRLYARGNRNGF